LKIIRAISNLIYQINTKIDSREMLNFHKFYNNKTP
jgi:hypothetical protein